MDKPLPNNPQNRVPSVMIVAGEASGDLHGGALADALLKKNPVIQLIGFGGDAMRAAGVDVRFDIKQLGIVGFIEVLFHLRAIIVAYQIALKLLRNGIDLLVLIDFPDFNLRLAKQAKKRGIPVVYYVSPQIWAWRSKRIRTIAKRIDLMLVILPFEKEIYQRGNVPCEFVGHPLMDELLRLKIGAFSNVIGEKDKVVSNYLREKRLDPSGITIALLPGSRSREVFTLLPIMLQGIERLSKEIPKVQVLIPVAPTLPEGLIAELCASSSLSIGIVKRNVYEVFRASDAAVVASGTATLQGALAGTPMVIVYKVSWITYWLGKCFIKVKSIGLANIVAGSPFIPELIQSAASPTRICQEVYRLIRNDAALDKMKQGLKKVAGRLGTAGASARAASIIYSFLDDSHMKRKNREPGHKVFG